MKDISREGGQIVRIKDAKDRENCTKIQLTNGADNPAFFVDKTIFTEVVKEYLGL